MINFKMTNRCLMTAFCLCFSLCVRAQTIYVDIDAPAAGDGLSWGTAYADLQHALTHADTSLTVTEIWVAEGTYYPSQTANRYAYFVMQNQLGIYGGFTGVELNRDERNWAMNETILSGDIDQNGILDSTNSNHIIRNLFNGLDSTAVLDGFTLTGGYAYENAGQVSYRGGAVRNGLVSPTFRNCKFYRNYSLNWGGAVYNDEGSATFINCLFEGNQSDAAGGALNLFRAHGQIINCGFIDNTSSSSGGALYLNQCSPNIVNCSFYNNAGTSSGAIHNFFTSAKPTITNCILWDNQPNEISSTNGASPTLTNCIVKGGHAGTNIWDVDPLFVDTATRDLNLLYGSPGLNAGLNDSIPSGVNTDLRGNERIVNAIVDLGAYEFNYVFPCGRYDTLMIGQSPIFPATYQASNLITSSGTVTAAASPVSFQSQNEITLHPLFGVETGAVFEAVIENPCAE